jgi:uncharacterized protein YbaR (Trm112 family)
MSNSLVSYLTCPSCLQSLSVFPNQLGRARPCPSCQAMVVAVESTDSQGTDNSQEKPFVLIPAPIILDATAASSGPPKVRDSEQQLPLLLACPSCNNELQINESKLTKPFLCPLCFRLLVAEEGPPNSFGPGARKRVLLKKAPPAPDSPGDKTYRETNPKDADNSFPTKSRHAKGPEIWPSAPVAPSGKVAVATRVALHCIIYLSLIVLLIGVYRQDWLVSTTALIVTIGGCAVLVWRRFRRHREERDLKGQLRSLSGAKGKSAHWLGKWTLAGLAALLVGSGGFAIFMAIQELESPNDFYLTMGMSILAVLVGITPFAVYWISTWRSTLSGRESKGRNGLMLQKNG